jgi:hypothetical protein
LKELAAMKTGTEDEMTMEQGSGLFEKSEDVGHGREGFRLKTIRLLDQGTVVNDKIRFQVSGLRFHPS